jgi:hypothetical protein
VHVDEMVEKKKKSHSFSVTAPQSMNLEGIHVASAYFLRSTKTNGCF